MDFGKMNRIISEPNSCDTFSLAPAPLAVKSPEARNLPDRRRGSDGFCMGDLTKDFEVYFDHDDKVERHRQRDDSHWPDLKATAEKWCRTPLFCAGPCDPSIRLIRCRGPFFADANPPDDMPVAPARKFPLNKPLCRDRNAPSMPPGRLQVRVSRLLSVPFFRRNPVRPS